MWVKEKSEKDGLKHNIKKPKIMASNPIHFMTNRRRKTRNNDRSSFLSSKITVVGDCRHEIKIHLLPGRKAMANLHSVLKSKDITLPTKVHIVKAIIFPVIMYGCESWTVKKAKCQRINAFELWCWIRLEKPLDCREIKPVKRKGNQP